ncbi:ParB/RepB/Spo0J family partition protein [Ruania alba]|uniref:Chromosome segregation DNA-binding protein n=1 Tax=Ruania alba TaxID=648782 RepID=A0A1H5LI87_9MICO|nr:ParB/RepB/Spo0J family partition protein [Ruania alba]SEE76745.1 chromosome segregation DNA-binding protein [Ruania alba]
MTERRRGLGRGLGALIPTGAGGAGQRPVDVFFPDQERTDEKAGTGADHVAATEEEASRDLAADVAGGESSINGHPAPNERAATQVASPSTDTDAAGSNGTSNRAAPISASEQLLAELEAESAGRDHEQTQTARATVTTAVSDPAGPGEAPEPPAHRGPPSRRAAAPTDDERPSDDDLVAVPGARFAEVPVEAIHPNASQPRQIFDDDELNELASSIREVGVLQPVVVRPAGTDVDGAATYELIMGERRWRASRLAGNDTVPAIIRDTAQDDMLRDALLENLHRVQLNPLEEAAAYQQLLEDFACTHDELAARIARSRPQISNTLRLLKLPPLVQRRVAAGVLSAGHARALLGLPDGAAMERLAQRIVAEGLSVRATEEIVTLGDEALQPEMRRRPRAGANAAALSELASRLSDKLDTKVKVNLGQRKGHVSIEFASVQDLNRILGVLTPSDPGVLRDAPSDEG